MNKKIQFYISLVIIMSTIFTDDSKAQLPPTVFPGMTQHQVYELKGEPLFKDERETSRLILWKYKNGLVVFKNGKVVKVGQKKQQSKSVNNVKAAKKTAKKGTGESLSQKEVDEIIAAIPNDDGKGSKPDLNDRGSSSP